MTKKLFIWEGLAEDGVVFAIADSKEDAIAMAVAELAKEIDAPHRKQQFIDFWTATARKETCREIDVDKDTALAVYAEDWR